VKPEWSVFGGDRHTEKIWGVSGRAENFAWFAEGVVVRGKFCWRPNEEIRHLWLHCILFYDQVPAGSVRDSCLCVEADPVLHH
jgi:hypothetical protein